MRKELSGLRHEGSSQLKWTPDCIYSAISEPTQQNQDVREILEEELGNLPHAEEMAIRSKFLLGEPGEEEPNGDTTLREIGRRHQVTGESNIVRWVESSEHVEHEERQSREISASRS